MHIIKWIGILVILLVTGLASCSGGPAPASHAPAIPTEAPKLAEASTVAAKPTAAPTAVPTKPPAPMSTVTPTSTPIPPKATATPKPASIRVDFTGQFKPSVLSVGEKLVVELRVQNNSDRAIDGLRIFTTGPWDKYTVVNVMPGGRFDKGLLGNNVLTGVKIEAGQAIFVNIVAYPNEPGNHEFTFIAHQLDNARMVDAAGDQPTIGGKVAVVR